MLTHEAEIVITSYRHHGMQGTYQDFPRLEYVFQRTKNQQLNQMG